MILPIYAYGQPVLKQTGEELDFDRFTGLEELISNMWDTMYAAKGVGLAAPQVGLSLKLFVVDTTPYEEEGKPFTGIKKVFINPVKLDEHGEAWSFEEGCLSIPDLRAEVDRPERVNLSYFDETGTVREELFDGLNARVIQHEYDHIQGILFIDLLKPLKKRMLQRRLEAIKKGQVEADYKLRFYRKP
ncbi:MAG TPA: peptide deformylase [Saprospiraceae bacterium]|nr:peptide deformylase [Saprospiraceae bacterium]HNT19833.1 peptide deformylase [Saprospiraceae bacterium]